MFVVRPRAIRRSPRRLALDLGCQTRRYPNLQPVVFDYRRDFLTVPVYPPSIVNFPPEYLQVMAFARKNKYDQRRSLTDAQIPAPSAAKDYITAATLTGDRFVVRPLRHSRGLGYRVVSDRLDFVERREYISDLYPKRREYRVIFVFGKPLIYMRKKPNEGVQTDAPWGHLNARFQTINDVAGCRLAATDCVPRLSELPVVRAAHIIAADIVFAGSANPSMPYAVLELNFCPGLEIDSNRVKVVEAIRTRAARESL